MRKKVTAVPHSCCCSALAALLSSDSPSWHLAHSQDGAPAHARSRRPRARTSPMVSIRQIVERARPHSPPPPPPFRPPRLTSAPVRLVASRQPTAGAQGAIMRSIPIACPAGARAQARTAPRPPRPRMRTLGWFGRAAREGGLPSRAAAQYIETSSTARSRRSSTSHGRSSHVREVQGRRVLVRGCHECPAGARDGVALLGCGRAHTLTACAVEGVTPTSGGAPLSAHASSSSKPSALLDGAGGGAWHVVGGGGCCWATAAELA